MILVTTDLWKFDKFTSIFIYVCYGVSASCLVLVASIYFLNMKQMKAVAEIVRHPMKLPRAICVIHCSIFLLILHVLTIVQVSIEDNEGGTRSKTFWFTMISIFCLLCFYMWCFALYVIMVLLTKYLTNVSNKFKMIYLYLISYIFPLVIAVVMLIVYCLDKQESFPDFWKWLLLGLQLTIVILMTICNIYSISHRIISLITLNFTTKEMIKRFLQAKKIRNGVALELLLLAIWISNLSMLVTEVSRASICVIIAFHSLLGPYFLVFETIFYDEKLRRPFRFQQQRKAIRDGKKNSFRLRRLLKKSDPNKLGR